MFQSNEEPPNNSADWTNYTRAPHEPVFHSSFCTVQQVWLSIRDHSGLFSPPPTPGRRIPLPPPVTLCHPTLKMARLINNAELPDTHRRIRYHELSGPAGIAAVVPALNKHVYHHRLLAYRDMDVFFVVAVPKHTHTHTLVRRVSLSEQWPTIDLQRWPHCRTFIVSLFKVTSQS